MMAEFAMRFTQAAVHFLWLGTLVVLVFYLVDRMLLRSAAVRHGWYLLGMVLMLAALPGCFLFADILDRSSESAARSAAVQSSADHVVVVDDSGKMEAVSVPGGSEAGFKVDEDTVIQGSELVGAIYDAGESDSVWVRIAP